MRSPGSLPGSRATSPCCGLSARGVGNVSARQRPRSDGATTSGAQKTSAPDSGRGPLASQRPGRRRRQRPTAARAVATAEARSGYAPHHQVAHRLPLQTSTRLFCGDTMGLRQLRSEVQGARVPQSPRDNGDGVDAGEASGRWVTVFSAWEAECWAVISVESFVVESTVKPMVTGCSQDKHGTGLEKG